MLKGTEIRNFYNRYKIDPENLILWMDASFPENTTARAVDHSKYAYEGAPISVEGDKPALTTSEVRNYTFDGVSDWLNWPSNTRLEENANISVFVWMKWISISAYDRVVCKGDQNGWLLGVDGSSSPYIQFFRTTGLIGRNDQGGDMNFTTGIWYLYGVTLATSTDDMDIYIDDQYIYPNSYDTGSGNLLKDNSAYSLRLCRDDGGGPQYRANAEIAAFFMFNKKLSTAEVYRIYNTDKKRFNKL